MNTAYDFQKIQPSSSNPNAPAARVVVGGVELLIEVVVGHSHHQVEREEQRVPGGWKTFGNIGAQVEQGVYCESEAGQHESVDEQEPSDVVDDDMLQHGGEGVHLGMDDYVHIGG